MFDIKPAYFLCALATVLFLLSCTNSDNGDGGGDGDFDATVSQRSLDTFGDENGLASFAFTVNPDIAAFQFLVSADSGQAQLLSLQNGGQEIALEVIRNADRSATTLSSPNLLAYPFGTGNLAPGNYTALYQVMDPATSMPLPFPSLTGTLITKQDADLSSGTVAVNLVLVGPLAGSVENRASLEDVIGSVHTIFKDTGLTLDVEWFNLPGPPLLPDPRSNDPFYEDLSEEVRPNAVNIVFGTQAAGITTPNYRYSISTGDSSPAIPSVRSVGVVSILDVAGSDGRFNFSGDGESQVHNDEVQLCAEEVAQLIGHALGLSHIVENDGNISQSSDALSDTHSCITLVDCSIDEETRDNLMFPFPIDINGSEQDTFKRTKTTAQQRAVMQRSVLVN